MGDSLSIGENHQFQNKITFIQVVNDPNFGSINIYRLKQAPFEYLFKYRKTFMEGDIKSLKYQQQIKEMINREHKNIAKIHYNYLEEQVNLCIKDIKVNTYCNYYNFNLSQALDKKKQQNSQFSQSQLIYIMSCLIDVSAYLKKFNIAVGDYRSENIFVSPLGYIKIYLLEILENNLHCNYYKALTQKSIIAKLVLSPQQMENLLINSYEINYDYYKADLYSISLIILSLVVMDHTKYYYKQNSTKLNTDRILFDLNSLNQYFNTNFINLLKDCLKQNPKQRISIQQASQRIQNIKNSSSNKCYGIRFPDGQSNRRKSTGLKYYPNFMNKVQKKLAPSPIMTMSSSLSNSFRGDKNSKQSSQIYR